VDEVDEWFAVAAAASISWRVFNILNILSVRGILGMGIPPASDLSEPSSELSSDLLIFGMCISFFKAVACDPYERYIRRLMVVGRYTIDQARIRAEELFNLRLSYSQLQRDFQVHSLISSGTVIIDNAYISHDLLTNIRHALAHANYHSSTPSYGIITLRNRNNFEIAITVEGFHELGKHVTQIGSTVLCDQALE
jgi:hypothetical protein